MDVRQKTALVPARSFTSASHSGATDVGITLRVPNISLPPPAQLGAHEDRPITKLGLYVGSSKGALSEDGFLMNKARRHCQRLE